MNESYVTLQGWVGNDVDVRDVGDTQCASFRVGSTPRYIKNGTWVDGQTSWYTVNCWRGLGKNVGDSIKRGDAVAIILRDMHEQRLPQLCDAHSGSRVIYGLHE